ncbi:hypothetical protein [Zobellella taiwanensis]
MNRTLVLHVGAHKTGTTTIQDSLKKNISLLQSKGILYIPFNYYLKKSNLKDFLRSGMNNDDDWFDFFKSINCERVVISAEEISMYSHDTLSKIKTFFLDNGFELSVHYFLREPFAWKQSDCKQMIKSGTASFNSTFDKNATERYFNIPQKLDDVFGVDIVFYHFMENAVTEGLFNYFCKNCLVLENSNLAEVRSNDSLSESALKIANIYNEDYPRGSGRSMLLSEIIHSVQGARSENYFDISKDECLKINEGIEYLKKRNKNIPYSHVEPYTYQRKELDNLSREDFKNFIDKLNEYLTKFEDYIPLLRNLSNELSKNDELDSAIKLLELARLIRPHGPYINNRLDTLLEMKKEN